MFCMHRSVMMGVERVFRNPLAAAGGRIGDPIGSNIQVVVVVVLMVPLSIKWLGMIMTRCILDYSHTLTVLRLDSPLI
ncbi:unnamed protein product [Arctogadus glacialis]